MSNLSLPADLLEEILSRVPAKSLKQLRSTCKRWNTLLKEPRFTKKHFRKAPKQSLIFMLKKYKVCSVSVNLNIAPPSLEFMSALSLKDSHSNSEEQVDIAHIFHCEGLLLCTTKEYKLVVWNPCLGETRWIQPKTPKKSFSRFARFALGYQSNKFCLSYKILRYLHSYKLNKPVLECEVYEFSSDSWRVLDDISDCLLNQSGVSLKGNTYWLAASDGATDKSLLCFDFTRERFRYMSLPPSQNHYFIALSLVREEQLSVLHKRFDTSKMEIWLTNKFDTEAALSWSQFFTVDLHRQAFASLLINKENKVALCCDLVYTTTGNKVYTIGENCGYYTEIPYMNSTDNPWWLEESTQPCIFNYVPSLVQIHQDSAK